MVLTANHAIYDPTKVLKDPKFRIVPPGEKTPKDANIAAFYNPQHEVHLVEKPKPSPGPGQVLIHVRATGICGSDVHFWKHGGIGDMIVTDECGSGHESAGEVIEVGEGVTELKVGDRVALEVGIPCSQPNCEACRTGKYNACPDVIFCSTPPYHGTLTRYHVHPAQWCHKLPDNMSYEEGALCEPLAVVTGGVEKAGVGLGDPVLVTGAGPIGLVALLCARAAGAEPLVITDLFQSRLDFAKKLVPNARTILIDPKDTPKQNAERVKAAAGMPIKVTLECTGVETSIHSAIFATKFGGKVFIIGVGRAEQKFPFMHLSANEIDLGFLYRYANQYPKAIRLISGGIVDLKPLVTHRFPLEDAISAFQTASDPTQGAIKVQIRDE